MFMVFFTNLGKSFSTKILFDEKTIHGHNLYDNLLSQMDPSVLIGRKPLTTRNIRPSKKPTCIGSSFLNLLLVEKYPDIVIKYPCSNFLLTFYLNGVFAKGMQKSFANFFINLK
jgi:hypothetical protein